MTVRKPGPEDKEEVLAMMEEFYRSDAVLRTVPQSNFEKTWELLLSGERAADAYLAEQDGEAAGYALLSLGWSNEAGELTVWLEEIYIRPQFRGAGAGRQLIARVFHDYAGRAVRFRLETEESNGGARKLYRSLGFHSLPYLQMVVDVPADAEKK